MFAYVDFISVFGVPGARTKFYPKLLSDQLRNFSGKRYSQTFSHRRPSFASYLHWVSVRF